MSDQNVFDTPKETNQETPEQTPASTDVFSDQLAQIKNERGEPKYGSVDEALKGAAHAQTYIQELKDELEKLKSENSTVKSELEKRSSVEETLQRLTASKEQAPEVTASPQGLDEGKLEELIQAQLTKTQRTAIEGDNIKTVNDSLVKQYGDKAAEQVQAKAKELGLSVERLQEMSKESPKAVLQLFNINQTSTSVKPSYGSERVPSDYAPKDDVLEKPSKSLLRGASAADKMEYFRQVKQHVYKRNGVTG